MHELSVKRFFGRWPVVEPGPEHADQLDPQSATFSGHAHGSHDHSLLPESGSRVDHAL